MQKRIHMGRKTAFKSYRVGERAIVTGGGLAGLSTVRVLSDRFSEVVFLDRDELANDAAPRSGVPQGQHPHGLLAGGLKVLEHLFPGFGVGGIEQEIRRASELLFSSAE
jgi:glycine/D-amino acid oxidase-like deaminating enzyme